MFTAGCSCYAVGLFICCNSNLTPICRCAQGQLSLMLELLGERNERIEQLELDVKVWGPALCTPAGNGKTVAIGRRMPSHAAAGCCWHQGSAQTLPPLPQEMKHIFHQQLSLAADQLHAAQQQLEQQQAGAG